MDKELEPLLQYLRLEGLLTHWDEHMATARVGKFSHERLLKHVLRAEYQAKQEYARLMRRK